MAEEEAKVGKPPISQSNFPLLFPSKSKGFRRRIRPSLDNRAQDGKNEDQRQESPAGNRTIRQGLEGN